MEETPRSSPPDRKLLERYRRGDVEAFDAIVRRYEGPLLRYGRRYDSSSAQDLVQEVFLRLVREAPHLGEIENLSAWLYRVARNLLIDASRKEKRMQQREETVAAREDQAPAPSAVERQEMADLVTEKLLGLPPRQRDVLILKVQEEKSYREISEITGLTTSNVGYLIHQGLKTLAANLRAAGVV
ncbi:MAG: sigma-70 family RNA polymerase sigma factor [Planctomycetes bacterium]|nr:sigma-70 family RNA polymerase sigma factor [Planctomycetota bacterium]